MATTMAELRALAKPKGLAATYEKGMFNAYIHIKADDSDGLDRKPPEKYNICIMTWIDDEAEQAAKEGAKAILQAMSAVQYPATKRRKKKVDEDETSDDNSADELESVTQSTAKRNLAKSIK